ncbi:O-antigen translocase [Chryseobacterium daecheongense]|uniref:PST family polysaccharide transporter n=1 Tax=Chryseobacterium daecheongense TaxID=192389 RepID=A0ABY2FYG1_9FLAO|nr:O-antigen translocase [Chryseobacterium daecheongense]TDX94498.1 PST family polysaccharide transporter [Chryseobacterium daecheongense]
MKSSNLLKIFSLTGISTVIKVVTSYITVKFLASLVGPAGIALIGQLQNFTTILITLGAGGINNGVVKYVAEYKENHSKLREILGNGFRITAFLSLTVGLIIIILSKFLSELILLDRQYSYVFILFGVSLFFVSINNFFISVLNGYQEFKKYVIVNIITSAIGLAFTVGLVVLFNIRGALISMVTYQAVIVFFTVMYIRKLHWFSKVFLWSAWSKKVIKQYVSYSFMTIVSAITVPVTQFVIRRFLIQEYSITDAGYWESMNKISGLYLMLFTSTFSVYYLPKLSEVKDQIVLKNEIFKTYKIFTPILLISLVSIFLLKDLVVYVLFTPNFAPIKKLFFWQVCGDFFKIMSWILAFVMVARSMSRVYVITEISFAVLQIVLTYLFVDYYGLTGAVQAYFVNYFIYFWTMVVLFKNMLFKK